MNANCKKPSCVNARACAAAFPRTNARTGSLTERYALPFAIVLAAVLVVCVFLLVGCASPTVSKADTSSVAGDTAGGTGTMSSDGTADYGSLTEFSATTLSGDTFTQANLADKDATLVNYWSTTCGPCIREMPDIAALEQQLPDNVQLITVCLDGDLASDAAASILESAGYQGTTLMSWDGDLASVARKIIYVPTSVVYGPNGEELGDAIIGGQVDLASAFVSAINAGLAEAGKEPIVLGS